MHPQNQSSEETIPDNRYTRPYSYKVVDMARAIVAATEHAPDSTGRIYNIVDDEPVKVQNLFHYIAAQAGERNPQAGGPRYLPSLGVRNIKAQLELAWRPLYPNYQVGLAYGPVGHRRENSMQLLASSHTGEFVQSEAVL